ncbi:unnamed protein product [Blepharisma stoltei]|uniref:EF-hand domain-containing protein n=1 Tax=Blepharisma stoltei TaxID=1481888 RepID=A0AAU9IS29_9CILI|nr:unnamed protein product [Blepharisma stoltei]
MQNYSITQANNIKQSIVSKLSNAGIQSLTSSELCLSLLSPDLSEYLNKSTGENWQTQTRQFIPSLLDRITKERNDYNKNKVERFKAGKLFLKSLDNFYEPVKENNNETNFNDFPLLQKLQIKIAPRSLMAWLAEVDENCSEYLTKTELINGFEKLHITPHEMLALLRIAGFRAGINKLHIGELVKVWKYDRQVIEVKERDFLRDVYCALTKSGRSIKEIFKFLDANHDGCINLNEMKKGLSKLNVDLSPAECKQIFALIDINRSGSISLSELESRMNRLNISNTSSIKRQESSIKRQESSVKRQESSVKRQESSIKRQESSVRRQENDLRRRDTRQIEEEKAAITIQRHWRSRNGYKPSNR